ncbi:MAG: response regulator [Rhodospirillaceae bacterium]
MRSQILFLDDDHKILDGLRRSLRRRRGVWDLLFFDKAAEALAHIRDHAVDVVVSDMRLPGHDGAAVLEEVRRRRPEAARIILSGYAEDDAVLRTVGPAHQYLAKPCEPAVLDAVIERALSLRRFLGTKELQGLASGLQALPSPPDVYTRLLAQLDNPRSAGRDFAAIIAEDPALTAQTLKVTNTAYFALPQQVDNLQHAVALLGVETLRALAMVNGYFHCFDGPPSQLRRVETLRDHSLAIGLGAHAIATAEATRNAKTNGTANAVAECARCAGVLSQIGSLAMMVVWPERFAEALAMVEQGDAPNRVAAERAIYGAAHPEIGGYMLGLWGFTDPVVEAVAYHHEPAQSGRSQVTNAPLLPVHVAQSLMRQDCALPSEAALKAGAVPPPERTPGLDREWLAALGLEPRLPAWCEAVEPLKAALAGPNGFGAGATR